MVGGAGQPGQTQPLFISKEDKTCCQDENQHQHIRQLPAKERLGTSQKNPLGLDMGQGFIHRRPFHQGIGGKALLEQAQHLLDLCLSNQGLPVLGISPDLAKALQSCPVDIHPVRDGLISGIILAVAEKILHHFLFQLHLLLLQGICPGISFPQISQIIALGIVGAMAVEQNGVENHHESQEEAQLFLAQDLTQFILHRPSPAPK